MAFAAFDVAKWFINRVDREAGDSITHLKVQKLLYFAEAWHQVSHGKELFNEQIEAWAHGPVVREVYTRLADFGWQALDSIEPPPPDFPQETVETLELVVDLYDQFTAKQLEELTHLDKPWLDARGDLAPEARCTNIISKSAIKAYFEDRYREALVEEEQA
jgi:uncharacterized phage-associated protein